MFQGRSSSGASGMNAAFNRTFGPSSNGNFNGNTRANVDSEPTGPTYAEDKAKCVNFLLNFRSLLDDENEQPKYQRMLVRLQPFVY